MTRGTITEGGAVFVDPVKARVDFAGGVRIALAVVTNPSTPTLWVTLTFDEAYALAEQIKTAMMEART